MPKILAIAGSTREGSFNKMLVREAAAGAREAGADVTVVDLRDYPMPLFDQDAEAAQGKPAEAQALKDLMVVSDGFLISAPEYNGSITAVLKNAIDWVSRPSDGDSPGGLVAFKGKAVSLMSASPGGLGGLRGLVHVRAILGGLGCIMLPEQVAVSKAHEAFDDQGRLHDERQRGKILGLGSSLSGFLHKIQA